MEMIKLEDCLKLNVPEIDSQHETLVTLINRLNESLLQGADKAALDSLLAELLEHARSHCRYEEKLMLQNDYPGYEAHKADHNRLMQQLVGLIERFQNGDLLLSFAVVLELKGWATIHIEKSDMPLGVFLNDLQRVDAASD